MDDPSQHRERPGSLTLVLGGVRSGKSRFAEELAGSIGGEDVLFVATAEAGDREMAERIKRHQASRPADWKTFECPLHVGTQLFAMDDLPRVVLIDCLTLLVSNVMFDPKNSDADLEARVLEEADALSRVAAERSANVVIVSGEVGSGVVPESAMGRRFRDLLGFANQRLAASSDATYLMVAGLAVNARRLATSVADAADEIVGSAEMQS